MLISWFSPPSSRPAASAELNIAPSAVSHALSSLEQTLGVRLLARSTRSMNLTDAGQRLLAQVSGPLADIETGLAQAAEDNGPPAGPLRLTLPPLATELVIMPRLADFTRQYPLIELDIRIADRFEDLVEQGFDAGIRLGESLQPGMIAIPVSAPLRSVIVASPAYFSQHPPPQHPRDLAGHNCIRRRFDSGRLYRWELAHNGQPLSVEVSGSLILPQQSLIRQAALEGVGLAFVFEHTVLDAIAQGRLICVMQDWCPPFDGFSLYYPSRRQMRPALRAFIEHFRYHV